MEIWKDVAGYEGRFKVSNQGRVMSINGKWKGEKILSPCIGKKEGYYITNLRKPGTKRWDVRIHTLVGNAFKKKPSIAHTVINHLDGDKLNNNDWNLEWTTYAGNSKHAVLTGLLSMKGEKHPLRKLNNQKVFYIKFCFPETKNKVLAKAFKVSREQVRDIRLNKNWKHITPDFYKPPHLTLSSLAGL